MASLAWLVRRPKSEPKDGAVDGRCREVNRRGDAGVVMLSGAADDHPARKEPAVTYLKDLGWLLLAGLLIPVFMAAGARRRRVHRRPTRLLVAPRQHHADVAVLR